MAMLNRFSIKSRLLLILLLVSISSVIFIGVLAYRYAQSTIQERILEQLTSVRVAKAYEIETYLESLVKQLKVSSADASVASAMEAFERTFESADIAIRTLDTEQSGELEAYYESEFLPLLEESIGISLRAETYLPDTFAGRYLQYQFIVNNPQPPGEKDALDEPAEASSYAATHAANHSTFRSIAEVTNLYDVFLIDLDGNIVYTVFKETDFGTNLKTGVYRGSGLAKAYQSALILPDAESVIVADFSFYRPSYNQPALFIATPIYRGSQMLGVLAFQAPVEEINRIMTGAGNWRESGLGDTGETYLVGPDLTLRSQSRLLLESPDIYFAALDELNVAKRDQNLIRTTELPTLLQPVHTEVAQATLNDEVGTRVATDFRGEPTLSSYAPVSVPSLNLNWGIIAQIDLAEAYAPLTRFQRLLFLSTAALVVFITLLAMFLANLFTRPINRFVDGAEAITKGKSNEIPVTSKDEFGRLATSLNALVSDMRAKTEAEQALGNRRASLISNLLPDKVAAQLDTGTGNFVERYTNVSVLFADLHGFGDLSEGSSPEAGIELLDSLIGLFDEAALENGVEKVKTIGADYLAICGASVSRLDHAKRVLELAEDLLRQVDLFNQQHSLELSLSVGLASGSVVGGVVGRTQLVYDIWGKPVDEAMDVLSAEAQPGSILLTDEFKQDLGEETRLESFESKLGPAWQLSPERETL